MSEIKCKMFESKLTNGQLIMINSMINKMNLQDSKENLVSGFTDGRSSNCKDLYVNEATNIIRYLKNRQSAALAEQIEG